jgi:predicted ATPase/Tfp pilus assembly protein PilF
MRVTPDRMDQIEELLHQALERAPEERAAFLARVCPDAALLEEVLSLLAGHEAAGDFLDSPPPLGAAAPCLERRAGATARGDTPDAGTAGARICEVCNARFGEPWIFCPYDGATLIEDPLALLGTTLDGLYRIEALLGQGGQGAVYRARHLLLQDVVAIKVLPRHVSRDPTWLERFRREGQAARRFRHPNAVTVYDLRAEADGLVYLVLEYVEGTTLQEELARRDRFSAADALAVLEPVAGVLDAAHAAGVVHRDLKPANVMLDTARDGRGVVKVFDLGIAKLREAPGSATTELTQAGQLLGTPSYMAPEQWGQAPRDGVADVDGRADVYSLGMIAYELVCGARPFTGATAGELRLQHLTATLPLAHEQVAGVPEGFAQAIARAMAKDRADRQPTAGELVRALRASLGSGETASIAEPVGASAVGSRATSAGRDAGWVPIVLEAQEAAVGNNLPLQLTSFIGREQEIEQLKELLGTARLLTLTGTAGVGKTRLAQEVASRVLTDYSEGVWLVELAALADPELVVGAVAAALGVREQPGKALLATLCDALSRRSMLLLLDNCEHVVGVCAALAEALLRVCPGLRVLATSREPLGIVGELLWRVPALSVPGPNHMPAVTELSRYEAVRLFVERARLSRPEFGLTAENARVIAEVCRRLEGIPLALELAAARVRALTLEQMLARMDESFGVLTGGGRTRLPRQQTMRGAIAWSYGLLGQDEKRVFERLAVFAGGCTLKAAEAVCGAGRDLGMEVLDVVASLVDKSLLQPTQQADGEARFEMLETIREYGLERLEASGETEQLRRRHADYYLALAAEAAPELFGAREPEWLERLEAEHDNVRAALQWLLEHDAEAGLRLAAAVYFFWNVHGHYTEGRRWLEAALGRSGTAPSIVRAKALGGAGNLACLQGDMAPARVYFEESVRLAGEAGDTGLIAWTSLGLGIVAAQRGEIEAARASLEASLASGRELGEDRLVAATLNALGEMARLEGEWAAARKLYDEAFAMSRQAGTPDGVSTVLDNLGAVACEEGDLRKARACYREALAIAQALGNRNEIAYSLDGLAAVAARQGAWARSARLAGAAQGLRDAIGYELEPIDRAFRERYVAEVREQLGEAALEAALAEGRALTLEQAIAYVQEDG